jgi:hypothetical protein
VQDSAKPALRASHGSTTSSTRIDADNTAGPRGRRATSNPANPRPPITAARSTLGCGRATTTNPATVTAAVISRARRPAPSAVETHSTEPAAMATLAPLTAVMCVRPAICRSDRNRSGRVEVSPTTSEGSRPPPSTDSPWHACRSPARSRSASRHGQLPATMSRGPPRAASSATTSSPGSAAFSRPVTVTRWPAVTDPQRSPPSTSNGAAEAAVRPRPETHSSCSRSTNRGGRSRA